MTKKDTHTEEDSADTKKVEVVHYKKIPLSEVVYVDIDDEVSSIFDRVKDKNKDTVYIVVPNKAVLFHSIINVKILKRKAKDESKEIVFITKDKSGVYFANKCGIPVFDNVGENKKELTAGDIPSDILSQAQNKQNPTAPAGTVKHVKKDTPVISIAEIIRTFRYKPFIQKLKAEAYKVVRQKNRQLQNKNLVLSQPNRNLILSLTVGSIMILFAIIYIALPSATLYLKPNSVPLEHTVNITLAEVTKNAGLLKSRPVKVIASYQINPGVLEKSITYNATGNDLGGSNARGTLKVYNKTNREYPLKPFTRFQTADGMVFRTQNFLNVAAGSELNPSEVDVEVVADPVDVNNVTIGDRGNLKADTLFTIPGIKIATGEQIFAKNLEPLSGGITSKDKIVTQADLDSAKEYAKNELLKDIPNLLNSYIAKINNERNVNLTLLNASDAITLTEPQIILDESIVGQKLQTFNVVARVEAKAFAYDSNEFLTVLKDQITGLKSPDKEITKIDEKGISYRVFKQNPDEGIIELTAVISGVERYDLSLQKESGKKLIDKIKQHVVGMEVTEAETYIEKLPEIETVKIKTWPFWAPALPNMPENIKIEINE